MKTNHLLLLSVAMSTALFATACNRTTAPDATPAADAPMAAEPAPMPAEPAPMEPAAMPADSAPMTPAMGTEMSMSFAQMDKNSDGGLTMDELSETEMLRQHFTTADSDSDGKLTSAEVDKHRADMAAAPAN